MISDIVTRWPPGTGATDKTRFVTTLCVFPESIWYTQVLPTAMGNGIDPADTNEFEVALGVPSALALAVAEGDPPAAVLADEVLPDAASDVLADAPHPASAITAAPARTARVDLNLLMSMPRSVKSAEVKSAEVESAR
jgi:hypothetical protein